jgi:hypothetical protein
MRSTLVPTAAALVLACACGEPRVTPTPEQTEPQIPAMTSENPAAPTPGAPAPVADAASSPSYAIDDPAGELPPSMTTPGPVPLAYRHVWAIESADCTRDVALTRIAIAPGAVRFYEGRSVVRSAEETPDELRLEVEHTAEGETSTQSHTLSLDAEGSKLTYRRNGEVFLYHLCQ